MVKKLFDIKSINTSCKQFTLCSLILTTISCDFGTNQNNINEQDNAEIVDATNELGSPENNSKIINTKLAKIKGNALSDAKGHDLIKRTFLTKDPKKVEALILERGAIKSNAPNPWVPICSGTTTMMDLLLDNAIGENDQNNSRVLGKWRRDDWRPLTDKFIKVMTSKHNELKDIKSQDGSPILRHYMRRTIRGNWRHTTEQLIDIWEKDLVSAGDAGLISFLAEESRKNSRDKKKWGTLALRFIKKCGKDESFQKEISNHRAHIIFIEDDWGNPNVPGELVKQFGASQIPTEAKPLYVEMLPRMIEKRDPRTYATSFDFIITSLQESSFNVQCLPAAIEAKRHDLLMKLLHQAKEPTMQQIVNSKYGDAQNLIAFYAKSKYYPGKASFEGFLNTLKEKMGGGDGFKNALDAAHRQGQDLKLTQEVLDILYRKRIS